MKLFAILLLVFFAAAMTEGRPEKVKPDKKCARICTADYKPVCAAVPNDKSAPPKLFGNECVLKSHNCEHNANYQAVDFSKCEKTGGIRLQ